MFDVEIIIRRRKCLSRCRYLHRRSTPFVLGRVATRCVFCFVCFVLFVKRIFLQNSFNSCENFSLSLNLLNLSLSLSHSLTHSSCHMLVASSGVARVGGFAFARRLQRGASIDIVQSRKGEQRGGGVCVSWVACICK